MPLWGGYGGHYGARRSYRGYGATAGATGLQLAAGWSATARPSSTPTSAARSCSSETGTQCSFAAVFLASSSTVPRGEAIGGVAGSASSSPDPTCNVRTIPPPRLERATTTPCTWSGKGGEWNGARAWQMTCAPDQPARSVCHLHGVRHGARHSVRHAVSHAVRHALAMAAGVGLWGACGVEVRPALGHPPLGGIS